MSDRRTSARALESAVHRLLLLHDGPGGLRSIGEPWIPDQRDFAHWEDWYRARLRHEAELADAWVRLHDLVKAARSACTADPDTQLELDLNRQDAPRAAGDENSARAVGP
jgi:hypothetical protein